jgi:hypothetical protein
LNHAHSNFSLCLPGFAVPEDYPALASAGGKAGFLIGT